MAKELKVVLPISTQNEGLINIIARKEGWSDDQMNPDDTPKTAVQVCSSLLANFIAGKVSDAFLWYYGESQKATKEEVLALLQSQLVVTFEDKV
jgi:hypothetical protein